MKEVFKYSIVYYFSGDNGYSSTSPDCVFRKRKDAEDAMEKRIQKMKDSSEFFRLNSATVYPVEVK